MPVKPATQHASVANSSAKILTIGDAVYDLDDHTPMMVQYLSMKVNYPQALLLYRMGDFYELFFDDAKRAAQILDITLTRRGTDKAGNTIAMAGVPFHAADSYMARLIAAGQTVVVCEQIDESATSQLPTMGAKSKKDTSNSNESGKAKAPTIMRREVVKTLTAGTITDDALISEGSTPTVVAIDITVTTKTANKDKDADKNLSLQAAISQLDLAAGTLTTQELSATSRDELQGQMLTVLTRFAPSECIVSEALSDTIGEDWLLWLRSTLDCPIIEVAANDFYADHAPNTLCQQFDVQRLDGLGVLDMPLSQTSCAALIHYARQTQQRHVPQVNQLIVEHDNDYLIIDANSQQNLELFMPVSSNGTSLILVVNHCKTPMGKRLLVQQMKRPLRQHSLIDQRLDAISSLLNNDYRSNTLVTELRQTLNTISDVERISSRIGLMSARPRDLRKITESIISCEQLSTQLMNAGISVEHKGLLPLLMQYLPAQLPTIKEIAELIERAIVIEPPAHIRDGGMIASGFDEEFDRLSHLHDNIQATLDEMLERERQAYQLPSLKVGYNKVSGFYFELPKMQAQNAPEHFIRRQTLKSSERFITDELKTLETEYLSAQTLALAREKKLYQQLLITLSSQLAQLQQLSAAIAQIDVLSNWAQLAITYNWQRPIMGNEAVSNDLENSTTLDSSNSDNSILNNVGSDIERQQTQFNFEEPSLASNQTPNSRSKSSQTSIDIKGGRHLVVEAALNPRFVKSKGNKNSAAKQTRAFVANDCQLGTYESNTGTNN
ncbi:MAG: DNA mismatch repair protein MutS, partial [Psychrobacter sp.]|nr:DNA mismatch repair protein MutS [Psychrobacter sp.]